MRRIFFFFFFFFHSSINRHSNGIDKQKTFVRIHVIEMKLYFIILKKKAIFVSFYSGMYIGFIFHCTSNVLFLKKPKYVILTIKYECNVFLDMT